METVTSILHICFVLAMLLWRKTAVIILSMILYNFRAKPVSNHVDSTVYMVNREPFDCCACLLTTQ